MATARASGHLDAADVQRILEERTAELAQVDEQPTCVETVGLVLFRLGDEWYGAHLDVVREIHTDFVATRLPRVPEHVVGVASVRGEILSVVDPARLLAVRDAPERRSGRFSSGIIVDAAGRASVLVVDEVGDIVNVPADSLEEPLSSGGAAGSELVIASVHVGDRLVAVVDVERMLVPLGMTA
jgi:purine-binding chemotaxis protein CheW